MSILPIVIYPDPILKTPCTPVSEVTKEVTKLLDDMAETMYAAPGVGLAAPQVGVNQRLIVLDPHWKEEGAKRTLYQLVNPKIVAKQGEIEWEEGCLSIPNYLQMMKRSLWVQVAALDRRGKPIIVEGDDLFAVCLQHEIDHLDGKLIIDGASRLKRQLYLDELKQWETTYPVRHKSGEL